MDRRRRRRQLNSFNSYLFFLPCAISTCPAKRLSPMLPVICTDSREIHINSLSPGQTRWGKPRACTRLLHARPETAETQTHTLEKDTHTCWLSVARVPSDYKYKWHGFIHLTSSPSPPSPSTKVTGVMNMNELKATEIATMLVPFVRITEWFRSIAISSFMDIFLCVFCKRMMINCPFRTYHIAF